MLVILASVVVAVVIVLITLGWAWRHGTLHPTDQERVDQEFDRIVRRLEAPSG